MFDFLPFALSSHVFRRDPRICGEVMEPPDAREEIEDSLAHIVPHKPFPQYIDDAVFLDVKELLNQHPDKLIRAWSENPRLYTLLRMLGFDDDTPVFSKFDTEQIGDFWVCCSLGP